MATMYVAEFAEGSLSAPTVVTAGPHAEQTVAIGGTSAATTNAFKNNTSVVRIHVDAICSIAFGTAPTATASLMRLAANQTEYFKVPRGKDYKVAVITNT